MLSITTDDGGFMFRIDFDRFECENLATGAGRRVYRWEAWELDATMPTLSPEGGLRMECWTLIASGDDVRSGTIGAHDNGPTLSTMLATLISFFHAWHKSGPEGENGDLFPEALREYAEAYADELEMLTVGHLTEEAE